MSGEWILDTRGWVDGRRTDTEKYEIRILRPCSGQVSKYEMVRPCSPQAAQDKDEGGSFRTRPMPGNGSYRAFRYTSSAAPIRQSDAQSLVCQLPAGLLPGCAGVQVLQRVVSLRVEPSELEHLRLVCAVFPDGFSGQVHQRHRQKDPSERNSKLSVRAYVPAVP